MIELKKFLEVINKYCLVTLKEFDETIIENGDNLVVSKLFGTKFDVIYTDMERKNKITIYVKRKETKQ